MNILVVEDDFATREAIQHCLHSDGYSVVLAENGKLGLAEWRRGNFDLICLDIMMPELSGYDVCKKIREVDQCVPILFLSAKREEVDVVLGLEMGADDFVGKPFRKHEFLARVKSGIRRGKQILSKSESQDSPELKMGGLTIFPNELRALKHDVSIDLTPREVSILRLLIENVGRPVSRDVFLDICWGVDYEYSRTLDTHIAMLRKKIECDPAAPKLIETVRGVGYRFCE